MTTLVRDVMTAEVVTVDQATPFKEVVGLLAARRIGAVPVLDRGGRTNGTGPDERPGSDRGADDAGGPGCPGDA